MRRVKSKCTGKSFHANLLNQYQIRIRKDACKQEIGSSDWTRTSDIRINSPPFYRLNYRGIVWSRILAAKKLLSNINSPVQVQLPLPSTICCHFRQLLRKILCRISISQSSFEMLFQHLSLRSLLNVTSAVRQAVERTSWFKNVSVIVCCTGAKSALSLCPFCWKMPVCC